MPIFEETARGSASTSVGFATLDVAEHSLGAQRMNVKGLPSIFFVDGKDGFRVWKFQGSRSREGLIYFITNEHWKTQGKELGVFDSPFSVLGKLKKYVINSILAIVDTHAVLMNTYGLSWALAAVLTGSGTLMAVFVGGLALGWLFIPTQRR